MDAINSAKLSLASSCLVNYQQHSHTLIVTSMLVVTTNDADLWKSKVVAKCS